MMDWILLLMIAVAGGLSTFGMISFLHYMHDKEEVKDEQPSNWDKDFL